jgi:uncharacterized membrane protein (DUF2068 family)
MRPLGVTLVGYYQILRGLIGLMFGLSVLLFTGLITKVASLAAEGNAIERLLHGFGHAVGLIILAFAVVHMVAGYGLLQMQNWGRLLTVLFSAIGLVLVLNGIVHAHIFSVFFGVINAASIIYLAMPPTRRAFQAERPSMRMAA